MESIKTSSRMFEWVRLFSHNLRGVFLFYAFGLLVVRLRVGPILVFQTVATRLHAWSYLCVHIAFSACPFTCRRVVYARPLNIGCLLLHFVLAGFVYFQCFQFVQMLSLSLVRLHVGYPVCLAHSWDWIVCLSTTFVFRLSVHTLGFRIVFQSIGRRSTC